MYFCFFDKWYLFLRISLKFNEWKINFMFRLEKMVPDDFSFAVELTDTMNWKLTVDDFIFNKVLEPNGCFVLFYNNERVGLVTSVSYGPVGWFGNLVVKNFLRGKSAGDLLVKHVIAYLQNLGVDSIGIYSYPDLKNFYAKFGFVSRNYFTFLKAEEVFYVKSNKMPLLDNNSLPRVIDFDKKYFLGNRQTLLRKILSSKHLGFMSVENEEVIGYVLAKVHEPSVEIGPLVCSKDRPDVALDLLNAVFSKISGYTGFICVPSDDVLILDAVGSVGFKEEFKVVRMFLGAAVAEDCIYLPESLERG